MKKQKKKHEKQMDKSNKNPHNEKVDRKDIREECCEDSLGKGKFEWTVYYNFNQQPPTFY